MCEKLFKHVGQFRIHSENHFKKIVDNMHLGQQDVGVDVGSLQEWDKITNGLQPCPEELLTGDVLVLLDELDDSLYKNGDTMSES